MVGYINKAEVRWCSQTNGHVYREVSLDAIGRDIRVSSDEAVNAAKQLHWRDIIKAGNC